MQKCDVPLQLRSKRSVQRNRYGNVVAVHHGHVALKQFRIVPTLYPKMGVAVYDRKSSPLYFRTSDLHARMQEPMIRGFR
jgi:hypothetical protein